MTGSIYLNAMAGFALELYVSSLLSIYKKTAVRNCI
jgi:hypothetical protein